MKRFFAILLALCLIGGLLPAPALADSGTLESSIAETGGSYAKFQINFLITDVTLKERGYYLGIAISTREMQEQSDGSWNCPMWDWGEVLHESNGTISAERRIVDQLVPNTTYYYFAYLMDLDRNVLAREVIKQFQTTDDTADVHPLTLGAEPTVLEGKAALEGGRRVLFSFTPQQSGLYALVGTNINFIEVLDSNGQHITDTDRDTAGDLNCTFYANANQMVYLYAASWEDSTENATVALRNGDDYVPALSVGTNAVHTNQFVRFQAATAGWYSFELSGDENNGEILRQLEDGSWQHCNMGKYSAKLSANDTLLFQARYNEGAGMRSLTVTKFTPPAQDSIVSASAPASFENTRADIALTLNVSEATAEAGYRWGVLYSVYPGFRNAQGNESLYNWTQDSHNAAKGQTVFAHPDFLVPGLTYYYRAVIFNSEGIEIAGEPVEDAHSFQAPADASITELRLDETGAVPAHGLSVFRFNPAKSGNAGSGMYTVVSTGLGNLNITSENGEGVIGDHNHENSADYEFKLSFAAGDGVVYIYAGNYLDETGNTTLTVMDALDTVDALTLGTAKAVHQNRVVSFTAPSEGTYRVSTVGNKSGLHIYGNGQWEWCDNTTGPIYMQEDETRFFILRYDERQGTISLIAEKSDSYAPKTQAQLNNYISNIQGVIELHIADVSLNLPEEVPDSVSFVVESGGTLTVPNDPVTVSGTIILDGGTLTNNGRLSLAGGKILWNTASSFINNNMLYVFPGGSRLALTSAYSGVAVIGNTDGTVCVFSNIDNRIVISGGATHYNTADTVSFRLPADITTIGDEAFFGIDAEAVYIPSSVTHIGNRAFANCPNLQSVNIQDGNRTTDISPDFLEGCSGNMIFIVDPTSIAGQNIDNFRQYLD